MTDQHTGVPGNGITGRDRSATPPSGQTAFVPPRLAPRFGALVVDWLLCLLVANLIGDPTASPWLAPLVLVGEYAFFLGLFGQTPGMRLARVRCGSVTDARPIGIPRAALRGLLLCLVVPALVMDGDRRGLHDRAVGSVILPA